MNRQPERITGRFKWVPMNERKDKSGLPLPPRRTEKRTPLFRMIREDGALYFINDSNKVLKKVASGSAGFATCDDESLCFEEKGKVVYLNVQPGEAVKIDEYDAILDSDMVIQPEVTLDLGDGDRISFLGPVEKGGIRRETVLLWDDGEPGRYVDVFASEE